MEYMSCPEAAEKWGVSKIGYMWLIHKSAVKPFDKSIKRSVDNE